ncbi:MAG: hypothetical protein V3U31_02170 [Dehalococcoidia bacterium]
MSVLTAAVIVFLLTIPFGYLRAGASRFSWRWLLWIHLPVLLVIALRTFAGVGWQWTTFPALIGAFSLGQLGGGWVRILRARHPSARRTGYSAGEAVKELPLARGQEERP